MTIPLQILPMLTEDTVRMDWKNATYTSSIRVQYGKASVVNSISGASELESLIANNLAAWTVDIRCPKTLYARTEYSEERQFDVSWNPLDTDGPMYLRPGLAATTDLRLPTTGLIDGFWGTNTIEIPKGWQLAQGKTFASKSLAESLLTFRKSDLGQGEMTVDEDTSTGNLRFIVHLASELYDKNRTDRNIQMAGLIAAFGLLGKRSWSLSGDDADDEIDDVVLLTIKNRLEDAGVPTWEEDSYDPARAATVIEKFHVARTESDDDD